MKLATLKTDSRDGMLIVVSKDLKTAVKVDGIVPNLQQALENWLQSGDERLSVTARIRPPIKGSRQNTLFSLNRHHTFP